MQIGIDSSRTTRRMGRDYGTNLHGTGMGWNENLYTVSLSCGQLTKPQT